MKMMLTADYTSSWIMHSLAGQHVAVLGEAPFAAAMARSLLFDFNMRPRVIGLKAASQRALEVARSQLEEMGDYLDFDVYEDPMYYQ